MGIYGGDEHVALTQLPCVISSREQSRRGGTGTGTTGTGTGSTGTGISMVKLLELLLLLLALLIPPFRVPMIANEDIMDGTDFEEMMLLLL